MPEAPPVILPLMVAALALSTLMVWLPESVSWFSTVTPSPSSSLLPFSSVATTLAPPRPPAVAVS